MKLIAQLDQLMSDSLEFHWARGDIQQKAQAKMEFIYDRLGKGFNECLYSMSVYV